MMNLVGGKLVCVNVWIKGVKEFSCWYGSISVRMVVMLKYVIVLIVIIRINDSGMFVCGFMVFLVVVVIMLNLVNV